MITGKTLISWGFTPGPWFAEAIMIANDQRMDHKSDDEIKEIVSRLVPKPIPEIPLRTNTLPFGQFIEPETDDETTNTHAVIQHMDVLLRMPTIVKAAVMPDACPSGSAPGTIPVGGVVATKGTIHPGFHSADICCSMAMSIFKRRDGVEKVLDVAMKATHFGPGGRSVIAWHNADLNALITKFETNPFLKGLDNYANGHFMTQGDGNHFLYVGEIASTGELAIVTHHGSRGLGAQLYKRGMAAAQRHTAIHAPKVPPHNAWIDAESDTGRYYWDALQIIREWTKLNHLAIHREIGLLLGNKITRQCWNEHNFVFRRSDGLFYHGKGATPSFDGFSPDDTGLTLIPLNMAQPILMTAHADNPDALGFAPHGAGRNLSRTAHTRRLAEEFKADARGLSPNNIAEIMARETKGLDVRFFTGKPDVSELPSAYKNAIQVVAQIEKHKLARVVDRIMPLGSIMAGEMNWNRARR